MNERKTARVGSDTSLGSCSLLLNNLAAQSCDESFVTRCEGNTLFTCQESIEFSQDCGAFVCSAERESCGFCGDGLVNEQLEECDDSNQTDGDGCDSNCTTTRCGNGVITAPEQCDDTNLISGDGCTDSCVTERCGAASLTARDFNGDGVDDLASGSAAANEVSVF